jgi:ketosteroid isomerase-like protein
VVKQKDFMEIHETEVIQAEQKLANAHVSMDLDVIDTLLHQDYVIIQPGGRIETKKDVLDSYKTENRHWDKAEVYELEVKVYGDMARVLGLWKAAGTNNGKSFDYQARFISIWIKESNSWKNISYFSSEINN